MITPDKRASDTAETIADMIADGIPDEEDETTAFDDAWAKASQGIINTIRDEMAYYGDERYEEGEAEGWDKGYSQGQEDKAKEMANNPDNLAARRVERMLTDVGFPFDRVGLVNSQEDDHVDRIAIELTPGDVEALRRLLAKVA